MLVCPALLLALSAAAIATPPVFAAKPFYTPDELVESADAIIVGKVQSFRTQSRVMEGEERTRVTLDVELESVEKGNGGEPGKIVQIECDRLTRMSPFGLPTHNGNATIPAPGSRAKFYLVGWSALAPNGIELLDGGSEIHLPMKPPWTAFLEWPLVIVPLLILVLIAWLIATITKRRAKSSIHS